jgi:hypothetical protein
MMNLKEGGSRNHGPFHLGIHLKVIRNNAKNLTHDKRLPGRNCEYSSIPENMLTLSYSLRMAANAVGGDENLTKSDY